jgi:antitoxin (DNA-binding transcriptional repressor) of toxin-antitoxin stability system
MAEAVKQIDINDVLFPDILDEVRASGERVVIMRDGDAVAEIGPPQADEQGMSEDPCAAKFPEWYGAFAGDEEFERIMEEVVRSRQDQMPRPLSLAQQDA